VLSDRYRRLSERQPAGETAARGEAQRPRSFPDGGEDPGFAPECFTDAAGVSAELIFDPANPARVQITNLDLKPVAINEAKSRLRELDRLYEERLIKSEEYHARRHEIIKGL